MTGHDGHARRLLAGQHLKTQGFTLGPRPPECGQSFLHRAERPRIARSRRRRAGRCGPCARRRRGCGRPAPPRTPRAPGGAPRVTASSRFCGPSAEQRGGRAHRGGQHQRLGRRQHAVQEIGGFLQRVGAVGDHHAGHLGARQVVRHARCAQAHARWRSPCPCCRAAPPARLSHRLPPARASAATRLATPSCAGGVADVVAASPPCRQCVPPVPRITTILGTVFCISALSG